MRDQIDRYSAKLSSDRAAEPDRIAFAVQDDVLITAGNPELAALAGETLSRLSCLALVAARPSLPFADFLVRRAVPGESCIVPRDTETRTFLHDIPFLRRAELGDDPADLIARLLANRKGIIVEGGGIIANGAVTIEQLGVIHQTLGVTTAADLLAEVIREMTPVGRRAVHVVEVQGIRDAGVQREPQLVGRGRTLEPELHGARGRGGDRQEDGARPG